jgi:hypothetical protein
LGIYKEEQPLYYYMHKKDGQMQLIHTCGLMPLEQPVIAEITHQHMSKTFAQCQGSVKQLVYQAFRTTIALDNLHVS